MQLILMQYYQGKDVIGCCPICNRDLYVVGKEVIRDKKNSHNLVTTGDCYAQCENKHFVKIHLGDKVV